MGEHTEIQGYSGDHHVPMKKLDPLGNPDLIDNLRGSPHSSGAHGTSDQPGAADNLCTDGKCGTSSFCKAIRSVPAIHFPSLEIEPETPSWREKELDIFQSLDRFNRGR